MGWWLASGGVIELGGITLVTTRSLKVVDRVLTSS